VAKITGRFLHEGLGKLHFWIMFVGTNLAFFPMHLSGLRGMVRRIANYSDDIGVTFLNRLSTIGAYVLGVGILVFVANAIWSFRRPKTASGDAWGEGNSLEWATTSPPPPWNFEELPPIRSERPVFDERHGIHSGVGAGSSHGGTAPSEVHPPSGREERRP
jgi:cytochrome c oxidase subunit I